MTKQEIVDQIHANLDELNVLRVEASKAGLEVKGIFMWVHDAPLTVTITEKPTPPKALHRSKPGE